MLCRDKTKKMSTPENMWNDLTRFCARSLARDFKSIAFLHIFFPLLFVFPHLSSLFRPAPPRASQPCNSETWFPSNDGACMHWKPDTRLYSWFKLLSGLLAAAALCKKQLHNSQALSQLVYVHRREIKNNRAVIMQFQFRHSALLLKVRGALFWRVHAWKWPAAR